MNDFLEEAAALLRQAVANNKKACDHSARLMGEGEERIALKFAQLAAIERGLIPVEMVGEILAQAVHSDTSDHHRPAPQPRSR